MMDINVRTMTRWCVAKQQPDTSIKTLKHMLEDDKRVQHGFLTARAPLPAFDDTRFVTVLNGKRLIVAVSPSNSGGASGLDHSIEIFFDPYADQVGYAQFVFKFDCEPVCVHHMPYKAAKSTRFNWPGLRRFRVVRDQMTGVVGEATPSWMLIAEFDIEDIFRDGDMCGFNVCRGRSVDNNISSWNLCSGSGFQDASSFGRLYRNNGPRVVKVERATWAGGLLKLQGQAQSKGKLTIELADPKDQRIKRQVQVREGKWKTSMKLPSPASSGMYRLYFQEKTRAVEPAMMVFDDLVVSKRQAMSIGMVADMPDDLINHHFTPAILNTHISNMASWGISRLYWIEYGALDKHPSYWQLFGGGVSALKTAKACGPMLSRVVKTSHKHGLECIGILKIFDLAHNWHSYATPAADRLVQDDGRFTSAMGPVLDAQAGVMTAHPDWWQQSSGRITTLRLISTKPMNRIKSQQVSVWTSQDNKSYRRARSNLSVRCSAQRRSHRRWTPAGALPEKGTRNVHVMEISGLNVNTPFASIRINAPGFECVNKRFDLMEAIDENGQTVASRLSWSGDVKAGFSFVSRWPSWANNEAWSMRQQIVEGESDIGLMFKPYARLTQALEPASPLARAAWMVEIQRMIDAGVDGVDLRILCHHLLCDDWSVYAFNQDVRDQFKQKFGRDVEPTDEDLLRVQQLRGEGLTSLLEAARKATNKRGTKLIVHIETGAEIPDEMHQRMSIGLPWREWITRGLVDELAVKFWSGYSRFIHEQLLPLAKRHGVAVHAIDYNSSLQTPRGIEYASRVARDTQAAGLDGLVFYENAGYQRMNAAGHTKVVSHADHAIRAAADSV